MASAQRPRVDSISLMKRAGGSPSPLRCSAARAARSASRGARCLPRPSIPSRTRPTVQAATTKITIIATTMEVTNTPFRQSMSSGRGKELSYGPYNRNCDAGGAGGTALRALSLPSQDHGVSIETQILALDFITTLDFTLTGSPRFASFVACEQARATADLLPRTPAVGETGRPS
jgi:hypothetical protein